MKGACCCLRLRVGIGVLVDGDEFVLGGVWVTKEAKGVEILLNAARRRGEGWT